jgi:hypothetical protein
VVWSEKGPQQKTRSGDKSWHRIEDVRRVQLGGSTGNFRSFLGINVVHNHRKRNKSVPAEVPRDKKRAFPSDQVRNQIRTHQQCGQEHAHELPQTGEFPQGLSPRSFGSNEESHLVNDERFNLLEAGPTPLHGGVRRLGYNVGCHKE